MHVLLLASEWPEGSSSRCVDPDSEEAKLLLKYFVPTFMGGQLQHFDMNTLVDIVGKLVHIEEPRGVSSRGTSTVVSNGIPEPESKKRRYAEKEDQSMEAEKK